MQRIVSPLVTSMLFLCLASARAEEDYQRWFEYLKGSWTQKLMGRRSVVEHELVAGGHALLMRGGDNDVIGLIGWRPDTQTVETHIFGVSSQAPEFLHSRSTKIAAGEIRGNRVGVLGMGAKFTGTDAWQTLDDDRCKLAFNILMGSAKLSGEIEFTRNEGNQEKENADERPAAEPALDADAPYRKWLKYFQGDWDVTFGDGGTTVFHCQGVAGGRAVLNQPDDGVTMLWGWRPDEESLLQILYLPTGGYQEAVLGEISDEMLSGEVRGWIPNFKTTYKGTATWRKIDQDAYELDFALDVGGFKYSATHKMTRKKD